MLYEERHAPSLAVVLPEVVEEGHSCWQQQTEVSLGTGKIGEALSKETSHEEELALLAEVEVELVHLAALRKDSSAVAERDPLGRGREMRSERPVV